MPQPHQDERLLKALAVAFVDRPRATLKDLAEAAGVSKATLHRFCGTRDNLEEMLMSYGAEVLHQIISEPALQQGDPLTGLRTLIREHLANREMLVFLMFQYRPETLHSELEASRWQPYVDALDAFFLRRSAGRPAAHRHPCTGDDGTVHLADLRHRRRRAPGARRAGPVGTGRRAVLPPGRGPGFMNKCRVTLY